MTHARRQTGRGSGKAREREREREREITRKSGVTVDTIAGGNTNLGVDFEH